MTCFLLAQRTEELYTSLSKDYERVVAEERLAQQRNSDLAQVSCHAHICAYAAVDHGMMEPGIPRMSADTDAGFAPEAAGGYGGKAAAPVLHHGEGDPGRAADHAGMPAAVCQHAVAEPQQLATREELLSVFGWYTCR